MNYFKNLSIKAKVLWLTSVLSAISLTVGGLAYRGLKKTVKDYEHVVGINMLNNELILGMKTAQKDIIISVVPLLGSSASALDVAQAKEGVAKAAAEWTAFAKRYEAVPFEEGEAALWEVIASSFSKVAELTNKIVSLSATGNKADEAVRDRMAKNEYMAARMAALAGYGKLIEFQEAETVKWTTRAKDSAHSASTLILFISIGGLVFSIVVGLAVSGGLTSSLRTVAGTIQGGSTEVASASEEIASASTELSASATEQAAALQETVASIDEVSAMVSKNADNAKKSLEVATNTQQTATRGKQSVDEMVRSMDEINVSNNEIMQQMEASNREISDIVKVIAEIGNKTKVINDIVFQTKLLSFNASVEAARAGEHGKGFAVVAEEVGNLAQMSGNAAKEISQMLEGSIQKVEGIVNNTRSKVDKLVATGKAKVEGGTAGAKRCGEVLDEIVHNVTELNHMVSEISTASTEQSQGVNEITKAMGQLDQVTQQNAAASQQASTAGEKMMVQATDLRNAVESLISTINGRDAAGAAKVVASGKVTSKARATVLPFQSKKSSLKEFQMTEKTRPAFKKAVGAENPPSENDPRFEDV